MLQQAIEHQQAGQLLEAGLMYQTILQTDPGHPEANHNLGRIAMQAQQTDAGLSHLAAAIEADPAHGRYWVSYIDALFRAGREDEARSVFAMARQNGLDGEGVDALAVRVGATEASNSGTVSGQTASAPGWPIAPTSDHAETPSRDDSRALLALFNAGRFAEALEVAAEMTRRSPSDAFAWKALGAALKTLGRHADALTPMRRSASLSPDDPEAHYNLGVVLQQLGRHDEAEASYRRVLSLQRDYADAWLNLGVALNQSDRPDDAEECFREVLRLRPASASAHANLGAVLERQGRLEEAERCYRQVVASRPESVDGHIGLGRVQRMLGRGEESERSLACALALDTDDARAHAELALSLLELGRLEDADRHFKEARRLDPQDVSVLGNHGNLLCQLERFTEAEYCYRLALDIDPDQAGLHGNLGKLLKNIGRLVDAENSFRQALRLNPDNLEIQNRLGLVLHEQGRLDEAEACYRRILQADPADPAATAAIINLGCTLLAQGRPREAADCFRKSIATAPDQAAIHSNLLYALALDESVDPESLFIEHKRVGEQLEAPYRNAWGTHTNPRDPGRCLQVGFVSADFYDHAVASFIEPVLSELAGNRALVLHAYYNHFINDAVTQRLRQHFAHWHRVSALGDKEMADKIRADGIDILIDLSGHTGYNRLPVFARKPAPVQASWIGYPGTTGLAAMDYYLADRFVLPPGLYDDQFTEKIVRLPANAPFTPSAEAPDINPLPALTRGHVTFGSFNRVDKLSRDVVRLWSRLLRALPGSRLLLGSMPLSGHQDMLLSWFAEEGIARERLDLYPRGSMKSYLALYHHVDLCLDTFPYNGGTTTHHALWMGVPTLTLAGRDARSRVGVAILSQFGLEDFVAADHEDFVARGLSWSTRLDALDALRRGMRPRLQASPARKPAVIAAGLDRALRHMWRRWCENKPAASFEIRLQDLNADESTRDART